MTQTIVFAVVVGFLAYAGDIVASQQGRNLTGDELRAVSADTTSYGVTKDGYRFTVYRAPDGTVRGYSGRLPNPRQLYDEGKWDITDGKYCVQFDQWRQRERRCFFIYHLGGDRYGAELASGHDYVRGTSGKSAWPEWRVVPGNPENL